VFWVISGKRYRVKLRVDRERKSQKYIGFLHESDGSTDLMRLDRGNTENLKRVQFIYLAPYNLQAPDQEPRRGQAHPSCDTPHPNLPTSIQLLTGWRWG